MNFLNIKHAVQQSFQKMVELSGNNLFRTSVDKDTMWNAYLAAFPEGTNPILRKRTEHDCSCCRQFIKSVGNTVAIIDGKIVSLWDVVVGDESYQIVADSLSRLVKSHPIENVFLHTERTAGTDKNIEEKDENTHTWQHFFVNIPTALVCSKNDIGTKLGLKHASFDVLLRSLNELNIESVDTVLELIGQNSLYRGEEQKYLLTEFRKLQSQFVAISVDARRNFVWSKINELSDALCKIKNTVIGTLLSDLSEGKDLEYSVKAFETKVAPINYKRPTALVTEGMKSKAKQTIVELGLETALVRRYAELSDITVNNLLFCNRQTKVVLASGLDTLFDKIGTQGANPKTFNKVEEVSVDKFMRDILPTTTDIEVFMENRFEKSLVSLVAPTDPTAPCLFKWDNKFSWSYNGELADSSIKERVKASGGTIQGDLCCRLAWFNYDDLDFHMIEPDGYEIEFRNKGRLSPSKGMLDVDMNAGGGDTREAVENIFYTDKSTMKEGVYQLIVHNFRKRENVDVGFQVEIDMEGELLSFNFPKAVADGARVIVAKIQYSRATGFKILESIDSTDIIKTLWNVQTNNFHKVNVLMFSPNYWDRQIGIGNKHYFFMLEGCRSDSVTRGFYNEFLRSELDPHRKTFEILGSKIKTELSDNQLSGVGFSSTQRNNVTLRVSGAISRIIKVTF